VAELITTYREAGFETIIIDAPAPYDLKTIHALATDVRALLAG